MNVYWIDSYSEYDSELVNSVMALFQNLYTPLLAELNLEFKVVDINRIDFKTGEIIYNNVNLYDQNAIAYINCINPSSETEKKQLSLYETAIKSKKLSVLNYIKNYPLADKNKLFAIELAKNIGIKTIPTICLNHTKEVNTLASKILKELSLPIVIKPVDMFGGIAVHIINSKEQLISILEILNFSNRSFLAQKKLTIISDCRLYIADFRFLTCLKRIPQNNSSLGNIAKGASSIEFIPPEFVINYSIQMAKKLGAEFLCVDWFETESGEFIFNEIETAGGFVQLPNPGRQLVAKNLFRWKNNE